MKAQKIILILAILFLLWSFFPGLRSGYAEITTTLGDIVPNVFSNKTSLQCQPGMPEGDYYSQENGQGLCGAQNYVHKLGRKFEITDGIGH
jgi:hypothetical protein